MGMDDVSAIVYVNYFSQAVTYIFVLFLEDQGCSHREMNQYQYNYNNTRNFIIPGNTNVDHYCQIVLVTLVHTYMLLNIGAYSLRCFLTLVHMFTLLDLGAYFDGS